MDYKNQLSSKIEWIDVFMNGLKKAGIELDRKVLADLALNNAAEFAKLAETAKAAR